MPYSGSRRPGDLNPSSVMKHTYGRGQASDFVVKRPQGIPLLFWELADDKFVPLLIKHQDIKNVWYNGVTAPHTFLPLHWCRRSWTFRPLYPRVGSLLFPLYKEEGPILFLNAAEKKILCFRTTANTIRRYSSPQPSHFTDSASVACSLTDLFQLQTQQLGIIGLAICWGPRFHAMVQQCNTLLSYCRCNPDVQVLSQQRFRGGEDNTNSFSKFCGSMRDLKLPPPSRQNLRSSGLLRT